MVLHLAAIAVTPHFRSYWVQRNVTEMKQYSTAISDLYRTAEAYREERVLVRSQTPNAAPGADIRALAALAPADTAFYSAQASPGADNVLTKLRADLLELKTEPVDTDSSAPGIAPVEIAGSAAQLDVRIDAAPAVEQQVDTFQPLNALLKSQQADGILEVFGTRSPRDGVFAPIVTAVVISASQPWPEDPVRQSLAATLLPGLTVGNLGAQWIKHQSPGGEYFALDGADSLYFALHANQLVLANDSDLLEQIVAHQQKPGPSALPDGVTYAAAFRHDSERQNFRALMTQLDLAGHRGRSLETPAQSGGEAPAFFSGNLASLSGVLSKVSSETILEKDQGAKVTQTVTYKWVR
jgi:hypothetical protein